MVGLGRLQLRAIHRMALRDLWHMRGQALAIALVIASGIAMLVMSQSTLVSLQETRDRLYQDLHFSDVWAQVKRAPLSVAARAAALPGVNAVQPRLLASAKLALPDFADPIEAVVLSLPREGDSKQAMQTIQQNRLYLRQGRMPEPQAIDEVLVSESFAQAQGLLPGDSLRATLRGRTQSFRIAGVAISPEYVYQIKPGAMFPDYERFAIVWMNEEALAAALDLRGAFNQLVLQLAPGANEQDVIDGLDSLLARYGGRGAHGRMDQVSYRFLFEEFRQLGTMTRVFPTIFLGVAAFLLNVVFTRLVGTQREQVAVLKAFGYSTLDVALHYGLIVLLICLLGSALGVLGGMWMGQQLAGVYQSYFRFPFLDFRLSLPVALAGVGVSLLAALLGTGRAVLAAASEPVAQAMRPAAPAHFHRTLAEVLGVAHWLSPANRIIVRQIERRPVKSLMTVIGLALAGAIMMLARFQTGSIHFMVELQYRLAQQHALSASFIEPTPRRALHELAALPGVGEVEGLRSVPVRLRHAHRHQQVSLTGLPPDSRLRHVLGEQLQALDLAPDGLILNDYLAARLGVGVGDKVWVEVLEGRRQLLLLPVTQLVREYVGMQAYMQLDALNRTLGDGDLVNIALMTVDESIASPGRLPEAEVLRQLDRRPAVMGAESRRSAVRALYRSIGEMTSTFTWISLLMGATINFGVVYNAARIALAERGRELASLRVLGMTQGEVSYILLGELGLLVLLSIPLSFAAGYGLSWYMAHQLQSDLYRVPVHIPDSAYAFAALVTLASAFLSGMAVRWRVRQLDLIAVLKTRE